MSGWKTSFALSDAENQAAMQGGDGHQRRCRGWRCYDLERFHPHRPPTIDVSPRAGFRGDAVGAFVFCSRC
jgi:hypothetical protein